MIVPVPVPAPVSGTNEKPLVIPVFIPHSGCPHQCAFCNQSIITNENPGLPDKESIKQIINQYLSYKGKRKQVELAFFGGNFLGLKPEEITALLGLILPYIENQKIDGIRFSTRPDTISQANLDLIQSFPISAIELGVQSMNNRVLSLSRRGHTSQDTISAIRLLKENEHKIGAQVMAGLPGDHEKSLLDSTQIVAGLQPDFARIYPLMVLKGSVLEQWFKKGEYIPLNLEKSINLVKKMVHIFDNHQVKVIRVGLQASDVMEDESMVVAGPWHPAFGHLVFSQIMLDAACDKIDQYLAKALPNVKSDAKPEDRPNAKTGQLILNVHPRSESRLRGDKNKNLEQLKRKYPNVNISILKKDTMPLNHVQVIAI
jgi:histone acetyltransferase (RNA polymerase elongator complex component)